MQTVAKLETLEIKVAVVPALPFRQEFYRFKYAEEFAYDLDRDGRPWVMYRGADQVDEEDGEVYVNPRYIVDYGA